MIISEKILEKEFEGKNKKDAYLNCCKWLSTNIIAVNNSRFVTYKIEKKKEEFNKVILTVFVSIDENEVFERNCNICKEVSSSFFMSQNKYMCESCKLLPYRKRVNEKIKLVKEGLKGVIL